MSWRMGWLWLLATLSLSLSLSMEAQAQTTVEYIHTDALGSVVAVTNAAGQVIERNDYEPYGAVIGQPNFGGVGFTGHVQDATTGLTYMQQRYYDPLLGRFLSVDPVTADANTGGNFNRYSYALNNPYTFEDPDGRAACPAGEKGCIDSPETESGNTPQPAVTQQQRSVDAQVVQAERSGQLSDGTRLDLSKEEQSFSASSEGTQAGINEKQTCLVCDGKPVVHTSYDLPKGNASGHTHGEGIEQVPGPDDARVARQTGQTAYVITKSGVYGVDKTGVGYRVRVLSGKATGSDRATIRGKIDKWNQNNGTSGAKQCTPGC